MMEAHSLTESNMAHKVLTDAKSDWMKRFDGPVAEKAITLGSPTVRHSYRRSFEQIGRNCHYITVFGRILLGEKKMSDAEDGIYKRLQTSSKNLESKIRAMRAVMTEAGIEQTAEFNQNEAVVARVIVPAQGKYLRVLQQADEFLRLVSTLWLEGEITDSEKSKAELDLKNTLRGITSTTRKMRIYLQEKVVEAEARAKATGTVLPGANKALSEAKAGETVEAEGDDDIGIEPMLPADEAEAIAESVAEKAEEEATALAA